ncbi:MAG: hypothetical protein E7167_03645 [Firmicutes bacterium]|nr:hypothetical protein [Bacillota bacterium]
MQDATQLTEKFKIVNMDCVDISTDQMPIIGTQALATCVGILIYSPSNKRAIVSHVSGDYVSIIVQIMDLIFDNGLENGPLKYLVIEGYYYNHYLLYENITRALESLSPLFVPFLLKEVPLDAIIKDPDLPAYQFAFDAQSGKFVSDKVLYGTDYLDIHANKLPPNR